MLLNTQSNRKTINNNYTKFLTAIVNRVFDTGIIPDVWKNVLIAVVPKSGDSRDCSNRGGISLIAHLGKFLKIYLEQEYKNSLRI